jgi:hypothetical protein
MSRSSVFSVDESDNEVSWAPDPFIPGAPPIKVDLHHHFSHFPPIVEPLFGLHTVEKGPDGREHIIYDSPMTSYYSFPVQFLYSFGLGLIFSPLSNGFRYFIFFSIVAEFWYGYRIGGKYTPPQILYRFGLFCVGFIGFLLGRWLLMDRYPLRPVYHKQICDTQIEEEAEEERRERRK